jgi:DNA topoisomerase-2
MSKDTTVDFTITLCKGRLAELESVSLPNDCNGLEKQFKLFTTVTTTNMHLFDAQDKLKKYSSVSEIIDDYYDTRLALYQTRKEYIIDALEKELILLSNKAKYIKENLEGTIDLRRKTKQQVSEMLIGKHYDVIDNDIDFKYLTRMPMDSVTDENVAKIMRDHENKLVELDTVKAKSIQKMWQDELMELEQAYDEFLVQKDAMINGVGNGAIKIKKKIIKKKPAKLACADA